MLGWFKRTFGKKKDEPAAEPVPAEPTVAERAEQLAPPAEVEAVVAAAEPTQSPEPAEVAAEPPGPAAGVEPEILPEAAIPEETEPAPEAAEPEIATAAGETGAAVQADREPEPEPEPEPAEVVAEADREAEPVAEVEALFRDVHALLTEGREAADPARDFGKLEVLSGVKEFPARVKCATLAWHTLHNALVGEHETAHTE